MDRRGFIFNNVNKINSITYSFLQSKILFILTSRIYIIILFLKLNYTIFGKFNYRLIM